MPKKLEFIKYVFVHLDGILVDNIMGFILEGMVKRCKGKYSAEVENNVLSQPPEHVTSFFIKKFNLQLSHEDIIQLYYEERAKAVKKYKIKKKKGLKKFLELMKSLDLKVVGYGGAPKEYFTKHMAKYEHYFSYDKYISTEKLRPGVKELTREVYKLKYNECLFIDESDPVAKAAKKYNVAFIGMPLTKKGFQKEEMLKTQVKYLVKSLNEIDESLLLKIDRDVKTKAVWK